MRRGSVLLIFNSLVLMGSASVPARANSGDSLPTRHPQLAAPELPLQASSTGCGSNQQATEGPDVVLNKNVIRGDDRDNALEGTPGSDTIIAYGGNDIVHGN